MEIHYLKIFNTVAQYKSFKKASEILHISQPALSIQVKKLENQIDLKLFYKMGNQINLTEEGNMLYEYTKKIFHIMDEMEFDILKQKKEIAGTINLGGSNTPGTYILPKIIGEMKKRYPLVTVNLHVADTSEITNLVENGTLDVAVNGGSCVYNSNIYSKELIRDKLIFVASPGNQLCEKEYIGKEDLIGYSFVVHSKTSQLYTYYKNIMNVFNLPENISMYFGSIDAIKSAIYADLGLALMPYYSVKSDIKMGLIKELKMKEDITLEYPYSLIYNKNKYLSVSVKKFIEVLELVCNSYYCDEKT
ncbi:LysR family transcriptional regulator [Anaerocolumna sp. MB42-C2]|uniref:LysR family transcriptional regulator n=1 Tax=Anaerocolumna sp. MB42-C2 TaxID=3070997 RepID=UPI0027DF0870|nr:LysR substrate-binding domain-containing protein [Anaerocolumna sp. MB42-C2]WMJ88978.1 LysR substrate-binding domain-containing protein [Anaerocolumna sp. MB42-C2]